MNVDIEQCLIRNDMNSSTTTIPYISLIVGSYRPFSSASLSSFPLITLLWYSIHLILHIILNNMQGSIVDELVVDILVVIGVQFLVTCEQKSLICFSFLYSYI